MPEGNKKSRSKRRVFVRTPKGKSVLTYRARKPKVGHCPECKKPLKGVPRVNTAKMRNLSKSKKRPTRPYGGMLCSQCTRKKMIKNARGLKYD